MARHLKITKTENEKGLTLEFSGSIDENANYSQVGTVKAKKIDFVFKDIDLINSTGIQRWILFMNSLPQGSDIRFMNCPIRVIHQMNIFPKFIGEHTVKVISFHAPYFCSSCDLMQEPIVDVQTDFATLEKSTAPLKNCNKCGQPMEFDDIEEKFFIFLERSRDSK